MTKMLPAGFGGNTDSVDKCVVVCREIYTKGQIPITRNYNEESD